MNNLCKITVRDDVDHDLEQQNASLQMMLDWKNDNAPEFCSTLRLYLSARRFLRHIQTMRLLLLPLATSLTTQNMILLLA
jgi:hypothetical protein